MPTNFSEFIDLINNRIIEKNSILINIGAIRKKHNIHLTKNEKRLFHKRKRYIDQYYVYHNGGNKEFQFNIGEEPSFVFDKVIFRYGLAFSFEPSQYNTDPVANHIESINRFNSLLNNKGSFFNNHKMWIYNYKSKEGSGIVKPREITTDWIEKNNFIFIGNYFDKDTQSLTLTDIDEIIKFFEELLPVWEYVQYGNIFSYNKIIKTNPFYNDRIDIDYNAQAKRNKLVGDFGEKIVLKIEKQRLESIGYDKDEINKNIRLVEDKYGFDIISRDENWNEIFIEVKTSSSNKESIIHMSQSEKKFLEANAANYFLYRLYNVNPEIDLIESEFQDFEVYTGEEVLTKFDFNASIYTLNIKNSH